ncbi:uncharacterized protein LOC144312478 [Canis aureus]
MTINPDKICEALGDRQYRMLLSERKGTRKVVSQTVKQFGVYGKMEQKADTRTCCSQWLPLFHGWAQHSRSFICSRHWGRFLLLICLLASSSSCMARRKALMTSRRAEKCLACWITADSALFTKVSRS